MRKSKYPCASANTKRKLGLIGACSLVLPLSACSIFSDRSCGDCGDTPSVLGPATESAQPESQCLAERARLERDPTHEDLSGQLELALLLLAAEPPCGDLRVGLERLLELGNSPALPEWQRRLAKLAEQWSRRMIAAEKVIEDQRTAHAQSRQQLTALQDEYAELEQQLEALRLLERTLQERENRMNE